MKKAHPHEHLRAPHAHPVAWKCERGTNAVMIVEALYWIDARKMGATFFHCEPGDIVCTEVAP